MLSPTRAFPTVNSSRVPSLRTFPRSTASQQQPAWLKFALPALLALTPLQVQQRKLRRESDETRTRHGPVRLARGHHDVRARAGQRQTSSSRREETGTSGQRTRAAESARATETARPAKIPASGAGPAERSGQTNRERKVGRRQTAATSGPSATTTSRETAASRATRSRSESAGAARRRPWQRAPHP